LNLNKTEGSQPKKTDPNEMYDMDKIELIKTIEIMKSYIKLEQESMLNKRNEISKLLQDKDDEIRKLKIENFTVKKENYELKHSMLKVIEQVKIYEDEEIERDKAIDVRK
jgi:hypothetical protein